jgi:hypothetical protein
MPVCVAAGIATDALLAEFRLCLDCGKEVQSRHQQMHIVLEFDTPERACEILCHAYAQRLAEDDCCNDEDGSAPF